MTPTERRYNLPHPGAVSWAVLLTSFLLFCMICAAATAVARWFLFESQVDLSVRLVVSKGRVNMQTPDGANTNISTEDAISPGALLQTDSNSQGYLVFEDNYSRQVLATVFILQDSAITLAQGARPRFEWSSIPYTVTLADALGRFVIDMTRQVGRGLQIDFRTQAGDARFNEAGLFRVDTTERQMRVTTEAGRAIFMYESGDSSIVGERMIGTLNISEQGMQDASARPITAERLNVGFGSSDDIQTNPLPPPGWGCTSDANRRQEEPLGTFARIWYDEQVVLHLVRRGEGLDHAETGCTYVFDQLPTLTSRTSVEVVGLSGVTAIDVRSYASLRIRAKIRIVHQDVTTCGVQGSECPIMFELKYLNANAPAQDQYWRHGFYAIRPTNDTNPTVCDTCLGDHEKLNREAWYIYESDDLFRLFSVDNVKRPDYLLQFRVYASGHAYDAIVADLAVIADGTRIGN